MALLSSKTTVPPDGFKYLQRETGLWIRADIWDELVDLVIAHREHKGLPKYERGTVDREIQRQMCLGAAKGVCRGEPGENYQPLDDKVRSLSLDMIVEAGRTLVAWVTSHTMASPEESKRRADICRSCPFNKEIPQCICTPLYKAMAAMIPASRREEGLLICGICGCSLAAKVLAPIDVVRAGNPEGTKLPEWCWQAA